MCELVSFVSLNVLYFERKKTNFSKQQCCQVGKILVHLTASVLPGRKKYCKSKHQWNKQAPVLYN